MCELCVLCDVEELWDPLCEVDWREPDTSKVDGWFEFLCEVDGLVPELCEVVECWDVESHVDCDLSKLYGSDVARLLVPLCEGDLDVAELNVCDTLGFWALSNKVDCDVVGLRVFEVLLGRFDCEMMAGL